MREDFPGGAPSAGSSFWSFWEIPEGIIAIFVQCLDYPPWKYVSIIQAESITCWKRYILLLGIFLEEKLAQIHFFLIYTSSSSTYPPHCYKPLMFLFLCSKPYLGKFCILFWTYSFRPDMAMSRNILSDKQQNFNLCVATCTSWVS